MNALNDTSSALSLLKTRRSVRVKDITSPAPNDAELQEIIEIATRVPDHGKLAPWKILVLKKEGQRALGNIAAERFMQLNPEEATDKHYDHEAGRFLRAPLVLAVMHTPNLAKTLKAPLWEQELCTGAMCMNLLHATHAMGYVGQWLSEWVCFDDTIKQALGGSEHDKIAGFFYIGSTESEPEERDRPDLSQILTEWSGL